MLPLYKLLSLFLRVFSRPLINMTKRYHANNPLQNDWIRRQFFRLGIWFHGVQSRINRKYLKTNAQNITIKPLSQSNAIDKGIQFFYEILFYSIAIGFPMYQIYRQVVDTKAKQTKLSNRVQKIKNNIDKVKTQVEKYSDRLQKSEQQIMLLSKQMVNKYLLFSCYNPNEEIGFNQDLISQHAKWIHQNWQKRSLLL